MWVCIGMLYDSEVTENRANSVAIAMTASVMANAAAESTAEREVGVPRANLLGSRFEGRSIDPARTAERHTARTAFYTNDDPLMGRVGRSADAHSSRPPVRSPIPAL